MDGEYIDIIYSRSSSPGVRLSACICGPLRSGGRAPGQANGTTPTTPLSSHFTNKHYGRAYRPPADTRDERGVRPCSGRCPLCSTRTPRAAYARAHPRGPEHQNRPMQNPPPTPVRPFRTPIPFCSGTEPAVPALASFTGSWNIRGTSSDPPSDPCNPAKGPVQPVQCQNRPEGIRTVSEGHYRLLHQNRQPEQPRTPVPTRPRPFWGALLSVLAYRSSAWHTARRPISCDPLRGVVYLAP